MQMLQSPMLMEHMLQDGKQLLTGWSDGKIRVYGPESGRELYSIHDAHHGEVCCSHPVHAASLL